MNRLGVLAVAAAAIFAVVVPLFLKSYGIYLSSTWAVLSIAAMGLNLTLGYAGQVSLAQGAFVGIGAYTAALMMHAGFPYPIAFVAAGAVVFRHRLGARLSGAARAAPLSGFRHARLHRAGLSRLAQRGMAHRRHLRPQQHRAAGPARLVDRQFTAASTISASAFWSCWRRRPGGCCARPGGARFVALRENPIRALSLGLDTRRYTLMAFAIGSSLGGLSGAVYAPLVQYHRAAVVRAHAVAQSAADGDRRRQRHISSAPLSARWLPCCCRNGCASSRPTTFCSMPCWSW